MLPADALERDILAPRLTRYDPTWFGRLATAGEIVWTGVGRKSKDSGVMSLASVRLLARGSEDLWLAPTASTGSLGGNAQLVLDSLRSSGARFFSDLQHALTLTGHSLREALRELVAAGLITADGVDALREVARLRPFPAQDRTRPDPARWLPAGFERQMPVVQRRPSVTRLPRWRRPDRPGRSDGWAGRWAALPQPNAEYAARSEDEAQAARFVAQTWLDRYGIVARDIHRREQPNVPWRAIYEQLRDMELRGAVRRGYFVQGLLGAQFALPDAVERLREVAAESEPPAVAMSVRDPANAYRWARAVRSEVADASAPVLRARSIVVTRGGRPILAVEARAERIRVMPNVNEADVTAAVQALTRRLRQQTANNAVSLREHRIRQIDDTSAVRSGSADAFVAAGWRKVGLELIFDPRRDARSQG
jgi:ATP-dependent Lhr-like helicase